MSWVVNNSFPKQNTWENLIIPLVTNPPDSLFVITDGFPTYTDYNLINIPSVPYPVSLFLTRAVFNNGFPMYANKSLVNVPTPPYPTTIFVAERGTPKYYPIKLIHMGACINCNNLTNATISTTVTTIGELAFANTSITNVTISNNCTYSDTSFPNDCTINKI